MDIALVVSTRHGHHSETVNNEQIAPWGLIQNGHGRQAHQKNKMVERRTWPKAADSGHGESQEVTMAVKQWSRPPGCFCLAPVFVHGVGARWLCLASRSPMAVLCSACRIPDAVQKVFIANGVASLAVAAPTFQWPARSTVTVRLASVFRARSCSLAFQPVCLREHGVARELRPDSCVVRGLSEECRRSSLALFAVAVRQATGCARNKS